VSIDLAARAVAIDLSTFSTNTAGETLNPKS